MSAASIFSGFVANNSGFLAKQAYRMTNKIFEHEDCLQEMYVKIITTLQKDPTYSLELYTADQLYASLRSVLICFVTDKVRASIVRNDTFNKTSLESTSVSTESSFGEEEGSSLNTFDYYLSSPSHESEVSTNMFIENTLSYLSKYEESLPGISDFFCELVDPSPETGEKYEEYKLTLKRPRTSGYIPMSVLGKLLGYDVNLSWKFELKIKEVLENVFGVTKESLSLS